MTQIFRLPCPPLAKRGSLSHSQALALTIRARDVAGDAIALPEFWSASGACARKGLAESAYAIKLRLLDATELRVFGRLAEDFMAIALKYLK